MYRTHQLVSFKNYPGVYSIVSWVDGVKVKEVRGSTRLGKVKEKNYNQRTYMVKDIMDTKHVVYEAFENELRAAYSTVRKERKSQKNSVRHFFKTNKPRKNISGFIAIDNLNALRLVQEPNLNVDHTLIETNEELPEMIPFTVDVIESVEVNLENEIEPFLAFLNCL